MTVEFEDPPYSPRAAAQDKRAQADANPGRWVVWVRDNRTTPGGTIQRLRAQGYEVRTAQLNHLITVYFRRPKDGPHG